MNKQEKEEYLKRYHQAKKEGVPFFPDILFKDAVISLLVFLTLIALAYFARAPLEARANPADTTYTPRPEWYFLFLFQLLKYFPGNLEVLGVVVLPTLAILLLFVLPFLDRSPKRHFLNRPIVIGVTSLLMVGIVFLTIQSYREAPPPAEAAQGDQTALLYAKNCAPCHGSTITVSAGTNLHALIAQGKHEGMPAWNADLTSDQIDSLAGFILSPVGSKLFTNNCSTCHEASELVAGKPLELKNALEQGPKYPPHANVNVPTWNEVLSKAELSALLNFLVAPDGQRLFAINCAPCHGRSVAFSGDENKLRAIISQGGLHLEMPSWQTKLSSQEIDTLAKYVVNPGSVPEGQKLFQQYCTTCHGGRVPATSDVNQARETIASGGTHQTMPVWGNLLTAEQIDALVKYTLSATGGAPLEVGQQLFAKNCSICHGDFGEGGPSPVRKGDVIAPISTSEFLKTRDDFTLRSIISQGQPNSGMSPFGSTFGGPLDDSEIEAIVAYMRSWESNPPVEVAPNIPVSPVSLNGTEIYTTLCAQCHGPNGEGGVGSSLSDPQFQAKNSDQDIFNTINSGHKTTTMIAWGEILTSDQIDQLVKHIRQLKSLSTVMPTGAAGATQEAAPTETPSALPTFMANVLPIFEAKCSLCHGIEGNWDASSYKSVMTSGDHVPAVIPGDVQGSLLAQKILGTQKEGTIMPPLVKLSEAEIKIIMDWIAAGAPEK